MNKLFCDIDSTLNNHWERIQRCTINGKCDFSKAFSKEEIMKDKVLDGALESLDKLSLFYEIHFLTARPFDNAYEITKEWLDKNGFKYESIIVVKSPMDKIQHLIKSDCLFIDDLSRRHEIYPPYKILYWNVIRELNRNNIKYEIFKNNWLELEQKYCILDPPIGK